MSWVRTMVVTGVAGSLVTAAAVAQQTPTRVYNQATPGIVLPTVAKSAPVDYTPAAFAAKIAGSAAVDVTVGEDGKVRDVLLAKSLDAVNGLDEAALAAAGRYEFTPATLNGQPVTVRVRIDMNFGLK